MPAFVIIDVDGKKLACRQSGNEINWHRAGILANSNGYTLHPNLHMATITRETKVEWPLVANVYASDNVEGVGRVGSMLYMVPCRKEGL